MMSFPYFGLGAGLSAALVLAGCTTPHTATKPNSSRIAARVVTDSVLRIGDEVSLALENATSVLNYTVSCKGGQVWWLYSDIAGKRLYPRAQLGKFGERQEATSPFVRDLLDLPEVQDACNTPADWRQISNAVGIATLVDGNSIKAAADGGVTLWGSFDYPEIALDPPFQAPYGRKAERFRLDCTDQKYSLLGGYDLDQREHVTDGAIFPRPTRERVAAANSDYRELFAAVCRNPAELKALPAFVAREKAPPPIVATAPAPTAGVFQAIEQLSLAPAPRKLTLLVLAGTHVFEGKREAVRQVREIRSGPKPGLVSEKEGSDGYEVDELSFMGFVTIQREIRFTKLKQQGNEAATELEFEGDWKRMPVGSTVSYTLASRSFYRDLGTIPRKNKTECRVKSSMPASQLHPDLKGTARLLECRVQGDEHNQVVQVHFLQDYNYLVSLESSETKFSSYSRRIVQVEQQ